ncbi:hypothetical protein C356_01294 [Cryptococcus neoformans c45]|nr:hypothetical protein C356_01294 [Cryptococcus neoformans var. grubii c45]
MIPITYLFAPITSSFIAKPKRWLRHLAQLRKKGLGRNMVSRVCPSLKNSPLPTFLFRSPSMQCTTFLRTSSNFKLTFSKRLSRTWLARTLSKLPPVSRQMLAKQLLLPGATIPSSFAARPPDFVKNRQACTADTWSFWLQYIAPGLLDGLLKSRFYKHFVRFSSLVRECLAYGMPRERP